MKRRVFCSFEGFIFYNIGLSFLFFLYLPSGNGEGDALQRNKSQMLRLQTIVTSGGFKSAHRLQVNVYR